MAGCTGTAGRGKNIRIKILSIVYLFTKYNGNRSPTRGNPDGRAHQSDTGISLNRATTFIAESNDNIVEQSERSESSD